MQERRSEARRKSYLGSRTAFATEDCLIRNVSPSGAKLNLPDTPLVPDEFDLYVTARQELVRARVRWRRADEIGVALVPPLIPLTPVGGEPLH